MIKLSEIRDKLKPDIMGWINQAIASATLSGITVSLPSNVAYTDIEQTFTERQFISITSTGVDETRAGLVTTYYANPSSDDTAGFAIGMWGIGLVAPSNVNDFNNVIGLLGNADIYGTGTYDEAIGVSGGGRNQAGGTVTLGGGSYWRVDNLGAGVITNAQGVIIASPANLGGGSLTNVTGLVINEQSGGGTSNTNLLIGVGNAVGDYSIYNASTRANYFGGALTINSGDLTVVANIDADRIALGQFATPSSDANVTSFLNDGSTLTSGEAAGIYSQINGNPAGSSSAAFQGGSFVATSLTGNAQNFTGTIEAIRAIGIHDGTATASSVYGEIVAVKNTNTGTITRGIGLIVGTFVNSGGGTFTGAAGVVIGDLAVGTNKTNLLLGTTTIPSGTYNIYAASTLANYFAGDVTIQANFTVQQSASFFPNFTVAESTFNVGPQILLRDARGSLGSEAVVVNGSVVGAFLFQGYDGSAYQTAAFISATINGTPGANDMPGALRFWTTPDGSTTAAEHLTIDQSGLSTFTQQTLGNEILRLTSTATNDDPRVSWYQNRVATTDATLTTIATVAVPSNTTLMLEAHIVARRTGGTGGTAQDGAGYVVRGAYKNVAGTATIIGAVNADFTAEDQAAWAATFNVSGGNVLIQVTGAANNNVTWHVTYKYYPVSS